MWSSAVFNVGSEGTLSLNSPANSASPGQYLTIFANGLGFRNDLLTPPDGYPEILSQDAYSYPPPMLRLGTVATYPPAFSGRAPGLVGVDQVNVQVPNGVLRGCNVPLSILTYSGNSQRVPVHIHDGGGACSNPSPPDSLGLIRWQKTVSSGISPPPPAEQVTFRFVAAVGETWNSYPYDPTLQPRMGSDYVSDPWFATFSGNCGGFDQYDDHALDAGIVTFTTPQGTYSAPVTPTTSTITLPDGTITPGSFRVRGAGGVEVGPFETSVDIPPPIQLKSSFPPGSSILMQGTHVDWTGGDSRSTVCMEIIAPYLPGRFERRARGCAPGDRGSVNAFGGALLGVVQIVVSMEPADPPYQSFTAPGLTLSGRHQWRYEWRFGGILLTIPGSTH